MIDALGEALAGVDFQVAGSAVTRAEWMGALMGLWMVVCNARLHPLGWVLAIASSLLYGLVFLRGQLYGQAVLQLVFVAMAAWGLSRWLGAGARLWRRLDERSGPAGAGLAPRPFAPSRRRAAWLILLLAWLVLWGLLGAALQAWTDSPVPYADALPTAGSVVATWLLAQRRPENWLAWLAVNLLSVMLFAHQALWPTAGLYAVFAAMSAWGWWAWHRRAACPPEAGAAEREPSCRAA